jgi:ribonuclease HII
MPIKDLNFTIRYYCGFLVPDSNVINRGLLGQDLQKGRFFEDFTVLIPGVVRFECDTPGGKKEFERLGRLASIGRIKFTEIGAFQPDRFKTLSTQERDDIIMQTCIEENSILLSADNQVKGVAVSKDIFTVFVP